MIDVYYKVKALAEAGLHITLHCFQYGRAQAPELEKYCNGVHYYKRHTGKLQLLSKLPFIVISRRSEELALNLLKDQAPILFEGLHCCYLLNDPRFKDRKKIVRMHNIEHAYYGSLARAERNFFKKKYFESESAKLRSFEMILDHASSIAAISAGDTAELSSRFRKVINVPAFHPHNAVRSVEGSGGYALYHGSLAVAENNQAALFLVREVFGGTKLPLIIAGNHPSAELKQEVIRHANIELRENVKTEEIYDLIRNAHVNVLPTFQATGIKLKLLAALFEGRHCVVNTPMIENTGLESLCNRADSADEMRKLITKLMESPFVSSEKQKREAILLENFSNSSGSEKLIGWL